MLPHDNLRMASYLLSLALTVEQHDDGPFFWVILESFDHSMVFELLMESAHGFATYLEALNAGALALKAIADDPASGPREDIDDQPGDDLD
jgi:hypothetical protein